MRHILFLSYGKDSMATLLTILKLGLPLDEVVYVDIMFNNEIHADPPALVAWIPKANNILKKRFGIDVKVLHPPFTFVEKFYTQKQKGNHVGDIYGYPYIFNSWCNGELKLRPISLYVNSIKELVCEYVGIAYDEPERYKRLINKSTRRINYKSVLYEHRIYESTAFEICRNNNLLSPHYDNGSYRGGCWFCIKQTLSDLYNLWKNHPKYFKYLVDLEKDSFNSFKPNLKLKDLERQFERGYVPQRRKKFDNNMQLKIDLEDI